MPAVQIGDLDAVGLAVAAVALAPGGARQRDHLARSANVIVWPASIVGIYGDLRERLVSVTATAATTEEAVSAATAALDLVEIAVEKIGVFG